MARKEAQKVKRQERPTIIGAGLTERWYFMHMNELEHLKVKVRPRYFGHENIFCLEKRVAQVLKEEGTAIVVFDADVSTWNNAEKAKLDALKEKYAKNKHVTLCDSLPSIEYWFLLHYQNTNRYFGTSKAVVKELVRYISNFDKTEGFLSNRRWVEDMCAEGRLKAAYQRAKDFGDSGESYTHIPEMLEKLALARLK